MPETPRDRPHLHIEGGGLSEAYTSPRLVIAGLPPARIRATHAARLSVAIGTALTAARERIAQREDGVAEGEIGFYLEFDIPIAERNAVDGLESKTRSCKHPCSGCFLMNAWRIWRTRCGSTRRQAGRA